MNRDLSTITRDLENKKNNDIIYRKYIIEKAFNEDPDIKEVLGVREKRPLNTYLDPEHPTIEEKKLREEILEYNKRTETNHIIPFLKLNGIQKEVNNFIMFDIRDYDVSVTNKMIKDQQIIVICMCHEDDMMTEYGIVRTDLLSYLVKDLLQWSNVTGTQLKCISDFDDIIDDRYYARVLKFEADSPNIVPGYMGLNNRHDKLP